MKQENQGTNEKGMKTLHYHRIPFSGVNGFGTDWSSRAVKKIMRGLGDRVLRISLHEGFHNFFPTNTQVDYKTYYSSCRGWSNKYAEEITVCLTDADHNRKLVEAQFSYRPSSYSTREYINHYGEEKTDRTLIGNAYIHGTIEYDSKVFENPEDEDRLKRAFKSGNIKKMFRLEKCWAED